MTNKGEVIFQAKDSFNEMLEVILTGMGNLMFVTYGDVTETPILRLEQAIQLHEAIGQYIRDMGADA